MCRGMCSGVYRCVTVQVRDAILLADWSKAASWAPLSKLLDELPAEAAYQSEVEAARRERNRRRLRTVRLPTPARTSQPCTGQDLTALHRPGTPSPQGHTPTRPRSKSVPSAEPRSANVTSQPRVLCSSRPLHLVTHRYTSFHLVAHRSTSLHIVPPRYTSLHLVTPRCTSLYLVAPRYKSLHIVTHRYPSLPLVAPPPFGSSRQAGGGSRFAQRDVEQERLRPQERGAVVS